MKSIINYLFILIPLYLMSFDSHAQTTVDSLSFESQRKRVNDLLDQRSKRFGDYTSSLEKKTGIFGLFKSKSDMQQSIDILKSVVINDNLIFIETRKLLDLKDSEAQRFQSLATEYDQQVTAYMKTISKLQMENERLRLQIENLEKEDQKDNKYLFWGVILLLITGVAITFYKSRKSQNVTKV